MNVKYLLLFSSQVFQEILLLKGQSHHLSFNVKGGERVDSEEGSIFCNSGQFSVDGGSTKVEFTATSSGSWSSVVHSFVATTGE